jgi:hypothetical protein
MRTAAAIGAAADRLDSQELSVRLAHSGAAYAGDLMIVGRAINGSDKKGWTPVQLGQRELREEMVSNTLADAQPPADGTCILAWVSKMWGSHGEYNTATSAFWRVARGLVADLSTNSDASVPWTSSLVWSNLYKIAPRAGGNPSEKLVRLQVEACRMLLADEIIRFRPKNLVFLTGWWAEPFLSLPMLDNQAMSDKPQYIHRKGLLRIDGETIGRYVVADHPQGKKEQILIQNALEALR